MQQIPRQITHDAACWRRLVASGHVAELIAELFEHEDRSRERQVSHAFSQSLNWHKVAYTPSFAELRRRRQLTSLLPCQFCGALVELIHPFLDEDWNIPPIHCGQCEVSA